MFYAKYYSVDVDFLNLCEKKGLSLDSNIYDSTSVRSEEVGLVFESMNREFPGFKELVLNSRQRFYKIFDNSDGIKWNSASGFDRHVNYYRTIEADKYDFTLASAWPVLTKDFDIKVLNRYEEFGFTRMLDFVCALSAMKSRKILRPHDNQYDWENNGIRMAMTADLNGDLQLEQTTPHHSLVLSPFGGFVPYSPIENKLLQCYFHTEPELMAIMIKYLEQQGVLSNYFGERFEALENILRKGASDLGPYGNAGEYDETEIYEAYLKYFMDIPDIYSPRPHFLVRNPSISGGQEPYTFYIDNDGKLVVYIGLRRNQAPHMTFDVEDARNIVVGICHNANNGVGRTGKGALLSLMQKIINGCPETEEYFRKYK